MMFSDLGFSPVKNRFAPYDIPQVQFIITGVQPCSSFVVCRMYLFHAEIELTDDPRIYTRSTTSWPENDIGRQIAAQQMVYSSVCHYAIATICSRLSRSHRLLTS